MNPARDGEITRFGMVIDLDRCTGCGACMVACAVENNVPPAHEGATERTGLNWVQVHEVHDSRGTDRRSAFVPVMCQHCGAHTPCESVCPQNAVQKDPRTGIVAQIPVRCLGCRYCMAACPYHARSFNWWDPEWPGELVTTLNPDVSTRTRGVVEKCSLCSHRLLEARARSAALGLTGEVEYTPACVEACPAQAMTFGDLGDASSEVAREAAKPTAFRLLERLGTDPKIVYTSQRAWVRDALLGRPIEGRHDG
jgi:molybdopterin-containing oxidoreductase family iron-sulfur binding subunit